MNSLGACLLLGKCARQSAHLVKGCVSPGVLKTHELCPTKSVKKVLKTAEPRIRGYWAKKGSKKGGNLWAPGGLLLAIGLVVIWQKEMQKMAESP